MALNRTLSQPLKLCSLAKVFRIDPNTKNKQTHPKAKGNTSIYGKLSNL